MGTLSERARSGVATLANLPNAYPRLTGLAAGALTALGFEPYGLWPLALGGLALFFAIIADAPTWRSALARGWCFGWAHFALGNSWIAVAFTYQANMPTWLGAIAVLLLAIYLAVFPALAALGGWWLAGKARAAWPLVPAFAGSWAIAEWLRSWAFSGYAWNPLAMVSLGSFERPGLATISQFTGTYALSGIVLALGGCWWLARRMEQRRAVSLALWLAPLVALVWPVPAPAPREGTLPYTLVQPDIRQEVLNEREFFDENFAKTAALSLPEEAGERLVLWPESGIMDFLREGYPFRFYLRFNYLADPLASKRRIARVIGEDAMLLSGTQDLELEDGTLIGARNSVTALDGSGRIVASYNKAHLVPYGEYLPMRSLLEPLGLSRLVPGAVDFFPGPGPRTLDLGRYGRAGVQVCYEIVFSGEVVDRSDRPDYIFNPSNDGWFGPSGPPQHLAQARMRAIEEGLPVLRSTTTGISAVIDARGVVRAHVPRHEAARLDGVVPPPHAPTLFARFGNWLALAWAVLFCLIALVASRRQRG